MLALGERAALCRRLEEASPVGLPVDLREVDAEDIVFSFDVLDAGARLFDGNRAARIAFETTVLSGFQEFAPVVESARRGLIRRWRKEAR
jgi:hypothetical protein